jgi:allophanate hydrolase subunit 1
VIALKERIWNAIAATSPEQRGYVLRRAVEMNKVESFSDLLTDLEPFIESDRDAERRAWARLVNAARAAAVANVSPTTSEVVVQHREEELDAAKTVLRNHDVDVDGLLKEQR